MRTLESTLQQSCIRWFALQHPRLWEDKRLHSVPNGGYRSTKTAATMKMEGQVSGVWDLQLTMPRGPYAGLFIEMKAGKNGLTDEQKKFRQSHEHAYCFVVCYTVEAFMAAIKIYLNLPESLLHKDVRSN